MRVCRRKSTNNRVSEGSILKHYFGLSSVICASLPLEANALIEGSRGWEKANSVFLGIATLWTIGIIAVAIANEDSKLKPVLMIVFLIGANIVFMGTSIMVSLISWFITIPFLFILLLWIYYEC